MFNLAHQILFSPVLFKLLILVTLIPIKSFAFASRTHVRHVPIQSRDRDSNWMPVQRIVHGIAQPAQFGWEPRQECRNAGVDPIAHEFYNSVNHLSCFKARDVIRRTIYGNNPALGKYYKCDGHDDPSIAIILMTDEDLDAGAIPDVTCPDHYALYPVTLRTASGLCEVGWDCNANAGGM